MQRQRIPALCLGISLLFCGAASVADPGTPLARHTAQAKPVTMYATRWCGICARAREYFRQQGITFREYDIEDNPGARQRWRDMGGRGVPLIVVGDQLMMGFSAGRFNALYQH